MLTYYSPALEEMSSCLNLGKKQQSSAQTNNTAPQENKSNIISLAQSPSDDEVSVFFTEFGQVSHSLRQASHQALPAAKTVVLAVDEVSKTSLSVVKSSLRAE